MPLSTYHIHIEGLVQGVGFRPFAYNLAKEFKLCGWVNNTTDGVHLQFNADENVAFKFYNSIINKAPSLSKITGHTILKIDPQHFNSFEIIESKSIAEPALMLTPDFAMCINCKEELYNGDDRRYHYPFITCTQCGPRFSIIRALPYDRPNTSMHPFKMCEACNEEYNNPENRRHYSQTNSCPACAVTMKLFDAWGNELSCDNETIINEAVKKISGGKNNITKRYWWIFIVC